MEKFYVSDSVEDTQKIAQDLVQEIEGGTVVCLFGDLAAGKTIFSQGIAHALGLNRITSPTFIIMREYPVANHVSIKNLYHLDLYRLEGPDDIKSFDLDEIFADKSNLILIEWPEKIQSLLPSQRIEIYLKQIGDNRREIVIQRKK